MIMKSYCQNSSDNSVHIYLTKTELAFQFYYVTCSIIDKIIISSFYIFHFVLLYVDHNCSVYNNDIIRGIQYSSHDYIGKEGFSTIVKVLVIFKN